MVSNLIDRLFNRYRGRKWREAEAHLAFEVLYRNTPFPCGCADKIDYTLKHWGIKK